MYKLSPVKSGYTADFVMFSNSHQLVEKPFPNVRK